MGAHGIVCTLATHVFSFPLEGVSIDLSYRAVSSQVLSAQMSLTTVFGMGTGGPSSLMTLTFKRFSRLLFSSASFSVLLPWIGRMVHLQGFEPGTHWLRVSCSTNWAKGAFSLPGILIYPENWIKLLWSVSYSCSSPRTISISQLNTLLHLHPWPIKLVVFKCPY